MRYSRPLAAALAVAAMLPGAAHADASFLTRFGGSWQGSGTVQRDVDRSPRRVSCRVSGSQPSANRVSITGTCRAAIIVTRKIGADIRYDPQSRRFSGTYTGSTKGPAQVSGTQRGDALVLTITYAAATYGDRTAAMTIRNSGGGQFTMVVTDKVDGADKQTSNLSFSKS